MTGSPSQLRTMLLCEGLYKYRYIEQRKTDPTIKLFVGRVIDSAAKNRIIKRDFTCISLDEIDNVIEQERNSINREIEADADMALDVELKWKIVESLNEYMQYLNQLDTDSFETDVEVRLKFKHIELYGYLDYVYEKNGKAIIVDIKSKARASRLSYLDALQISFYKYALESIDAFDAIETELHYLIPWPKRTANRIIRLKCQAMELSVIEQYSKRLAQIIENRGTDVRLVPQANVCSAKYCPGFSDCPVGKYKLKNGI